MLIKQTYQYQKKNEYVYVPQTSTKTDNMVKKESIQALTEVLSSIAIPYSTAHTSVEDDAKVVDFQTPGETTPLENINIQLVDPAQYLESHGIKCNDGRATGGNLWVKYKPEIEDILIRCEKECGITFNRGKTFWKYM